MIKDDPTIALVAQLAGSSPTDPTETQVAQLRRRDVIVMRFLPRIMAGEMTQEEAYKIADEILHQSSSGKTPVL